MNILAQAKQKANNRRVDENRRKNQELQECNRIETQRKSFTKKILDVLSELDGVDGFKVQREDNYMFPAKIYKKNKLIGTLKIEYQPREEARNVDDWGVPEGFYASIPITSYGENQKYLAYAGTGWKSIDDCIKRFRESLAEGLSIYY